VLGRGVVVLPLEMKVLLVWKWEKKEAVAHMLDPHAGDG
jgi:hypothetical protein